MLDSLLNLVKEKGASDLHLCEGCRPFLRVHGSIVEQRNLEIFRREHAEEFIKSFIPKELVGYIAKKRDIDFSFTHKDALRFRAHIYHAQKKLNFALRLLPIDIPNAKSLGIPPSLVDYVMSSEAGLFIVTGPTGSGKSTTIASLIDNLNQEKNLHIITIEDPVEYLFKNKKSFIKQREIGKDDGDIKTFASALRSVLREDPDVIFVGEMRDQATIRLALRAAETGHLVFSTLHSAYASQIPLRIVDAFGASEQEQVKNQFAYVFCGAIAQRLIPRKDGTGRVAAFEVLATNGAVRNLIKEGKLQGIRDIMQTSKNADIFRNGIFEPTSPEEPEMMLLEESIDKLRAQGII